MEIEISSELKRCKLIDLKEDDRFSILPDNVSYHIFSFFTIKDIAILSLTSKRCKDLCVSLPSLVIDMSKIKLVERFRIPFMDFIASLIANRQSAELTSLTIRWSCKELDYDDGYRETYRIMSLLSSAIHCRINEINLSFNLYDHVEFVIPLELFYCESLTSLKVSMNNGKLELPCPYGFSYLESLQLDGVDIVHADFGGWISSFCKFMKKLFLKSVLYEDKSLPFIFNSLQTLELHHSSLTDDVNPPIAVFFQGLQLDVKTLHIKPVQEFTKETNASSASMSGFGANFWETQNILFVGGLEELQIDLVGGKNEEALVEFLLKNGKKLKKVVILSGGTSIPANILTKLVSAALVSGANLESKEGKIVLELNTQPME
ncbi:F-box/LRR-repeat protein At3g58930-like [Rutidosis leptorrhynchoides]|uniref:F-box/LRR-repeat protein At3g58930-like n=1 Tax=Rutidosis leptorrhynchoides TaxID=125765 RepID=UPI003A99E2F7